MFDNTEYANCPHCHSKRISVSKNFVTKTLTIKCENSEECGALIEKRPLREEECE